MGGVNWTLKKLHRTTNTKSNSLRIIETPMPDQGEKLRILN